MRLIGISGYARSGKDSLAKALVDRHGYERIAFADVLKDLAVAIDPVLATRVASVGWEVAKRRAWVRSRLQVIGVAARDVLGEDVWVDAAWRRLVSDGLYVVSDCRFPNEARRVTASGGPVVRVRRPGYGAANDHISEVALDDWPFDVVVDNDGSLEDLNVAADLLVQGTRAHKRAVLRAAS